MPLIYVGTLCNVDDGVPSVKAFESLAAGIAYLRDLVTEDCDDEFRDDAEEKLEHLGTLAEPQEGCVAAIHLDSDNIVSLHGCEVGRQSPD